MLLYLRSPMKKYLVLSLLLLAISCGKAPDSPREKKPIVYVSIAPYQGLAQRLAGPSIQVETIVPESANPHSFEPTSKQVARMNESRIWFCIGEPFEKKLLPLLKKRNKDLVSYDLREKIELIAEEGLSCKHCSMDHQDRHIWMSPKDTQIQVTQMASALEKTFPEKAEEISKNLEVLLADLKQLDQKIHSLLDHSRRRSILVSHPAFGYFCRDYGCHQLSVEYEGKDPRPKHIEDILARAAKEHTEIGIVLPQYNNKGAQLIAEKLHIPVCMIDPYSPDYFHTLLKVAQCIADAEATQQI